MKLPGISDLSIKHRIVIICVLGILLLIGAYYLIWRPQFDEKQRLASEADSLVQQHNKLLAIKADLPRAKKEFIQLKANLETVLRQIPEDKEIPGLLRQVSSTAQETKTRLKYFAPRQTQARDFYSELPFDIRYSGSYHNLGYFFDGVSKLERIVHITSFTLESKGADDKIVLDGNCVAKTYVASKEASGDGAKKDKKK